MVGWLDDGSVEWMDRSSVGERWMVVGGWIGGEDGGGWWMGSGVEMR